MTENLQLTDEETAALESELRRIIDDDRFPFSPCIQTFEGNSEQDPRSRSGSLYQHADITSHRTP
jgi:hypothetical protein